MTEFDEVLDTSGLSCPLPVLKSKKAIKKMEVGKVLKIISTDPGSKNDIPAWARVTGNEIVAEEEDGSSFVFYVKKVK